MAMWPDVTAKVEVGSFAFMHAVRLQNCTLRSKEMVLPHTLFTNKDPPLTPHDFRDFGLPVYVLYKTLQSGTISSPGKWKEQCYQDVYVNHSPNHASNIILVYNPKI
jgi:hypothetical protein